MNRVYNPNLTKMNLSLSLLKGDDGGVVDLGEEDRDVDRRLSSSPPDLFSLFADERRLL